MGAPNWNPTNEKFPISTWLTEQQNLIFIGSCSELMILVKYFLYQYWTTLSMVVQYRLLLLNLPLNGDIPKLCFKFSQRLLYSFTFLFDSSSCFWRFLTFLSWLKSSGGSVAFRFRLEESPEEEFEVEAEAFSTCLVSFSISFFSLLLSFRGCPYR